MSVEVSDIGLGAVLIVGGSGFVGSHCIRDVLRNGASKVCSLNSRIPPPENKIDDVDYHAADLGDAGEVERIVLLTKPDVVIHTSSPRPFIEKATVYDRVNVQGTRNLLAACDKAGTTRAYVYCSSVSVIHDGQMDLRYADETWPVLYAPQQTEPYWNSKAMGENLVLQHNRKNVQQMLTTSLRVTSIFGEGDKQIIGGITAQARSGQLKTQIGDGKNRNDWTYVGNVAAAHTLAAKRLLRAVHTPDPDDLRVEGEAFFVTNDDPRPFWDFARQVAREADHPVKPEEIIDFAIIHGLCYRLCVRMRFCVIDQIFCIDKAKRQLGFTPEVGIDEAIRRSVAPLLAEQQKFFAKTK